MTARTAAVGVLGLAALHEYAFALAIDAPDSP
jgi:hypothetical protein